MISNMSKVVLSIVLMLMVLYSACIVAPGSKSNKSLVISSLEAQYADVYYRAPLKSGVLFRPLKAIQYISRGHLMVAA